jgi:CPA2 family monovalent cation:H+ antiporter-2
METPHSHLSGQVVIVGYGRVGRRVGEALAARGIFFVVVEQQREVVEALRAQGIDAVTGDANEPLALVQAHVARAAAMVIATPDTLQVRKMVETARTLNPTIEIVIRVDAGPRSEEEADLLEREHAGTVFVAERELGNRMAEHLIAKLNAKQP